MKLFEVSKPSIQAIVILTYILFNFLEYYFNKIFKGKEILPMHIILDHANTSISQMLSGIIALIIKMSFKKPQRTKSQRCNSLLLTEEKKVNKEKNKYFIITIIFIDLFYLTMIIISLVNHEVSGAGSLYIFLSIGYIFCAIFSYYILNYRLYRHHFVSIIIIIFGSLLSIIPLVKGWETIGFFKLIFYYFFYSLYFVMIKLVHVKYNKNSFEILFLIGLINFMISIIFALILQFVDNDSTSLQRIFGKYDKLFSWEEFKDIFGDKEHKYFIAQFFVHIIFRFGFHLSIVLIIDYYTPIHCNLADMVYVLLRSITLNIINHTVYEWYVYTAIIIMIIGSLIYNEIIILNFMNLEENTKMKIMERAYLDKNTKISTELFECSDTHYEAINSDE